ncbi:hypothetical protein P280DRAFT_484589 [Massarina eburnea CBS 473.64]|uniref:Uncharacterized protein n=1 Tax=Massarina eburnea CBS 473.64 TaxID=1395130 RepID=A0A6A6RJ42_9PLEO|nr:hypothetical protein P280DRAFT_484589 [Massarina eburnea CBS 473.64]
MSPLPYPTSNVTTSSTNHIDDTPKDKPVISGVAIVGIVLSITFVAVVVGLVYYALKPITSLAYEALRPIEINPGKRRIVTLPLSPPLYSNYSQANLFLMLVFTDLPVDDSRQEINKRAFNTLDKNTMKNLIIALAVTATVVICISIGSLFYRHRARKVQRWKRIKRHQQWLNTARPGYQLRRSPYIAPQKPEDPEMGIRGPDLGSDMNLPPRPVPVVYATQFRTVPVPQSARKTESTSDTYVGSSTVETDSVVLRDSILDGVPDGSVRASIGQASVMPISTIPSVSNITMHRPTDVGEQAAEASLSSRSTHSFSGFSGVYVDENGNHLPTSTADDIFIIGEDDEEDESFQNVKLNA